MRVPSPGSIARILTDLFDKKVTASLAPRLELRPGKSLMAALYTDDLKLPAYVCICNLEFAARSAAALALMPPAAAEEDIAARKLSPALGENLTEILNICAQALNRVSESHIRLAMVGEFEELPTKSRIATVTCGNRADLTVDIQRYGEGRLTFVELPGLLK